MHNRIHQRYYSCYTSSSKERNRKYVNIDKSNKREMYLPLSNPSQLLSLSFLSFLRAHVSAGDSIDLEAPSNAFSRHSYRSKRLMTDSMESKSRVSCHVTVYFIRFCRELIARPFLRTPYGSLRRPVSVFCHRKLNVCKLRLLDLRELKRARLGHVYRWPVYQCRRWRKQMINLFWSGWF